MGLIKDRNGMDLTEAEDIKKRWQEYTEELYKKELHDQDNHDGVITHLDPDILECGMKQAKTNRVLPRKCTGHSKHPLSTTQEKTLHMDISRWSTPKSDGLYSFQPKMEKLYTVNKNKTRS